MHVLRILEQTYVVSIQGKKELFKFNLFVAVKQTNKSSKVEEYSKSKQIL